MYKVDSDVRYSQGGNNVSICAYDTNNDGYDEQILKNGRSDVCKFITSDDGFFNLYGVNYDPDDNSYMDLKFGIKMKNDDVEIKGTDSYDDSIISKTFFQGATETRHNESRTNINVGNVVGVNNNHVLPYFYLETITNAHNNLYSKTNYDIPKVDIVNSPFVFRHIEYLHGGSEHDFIENTISYMSLSSNVGVNLQYSSILTHEYGHHIQHRVYEDKHSSAIPPCSSHVFTDFRTQECGWSEGWAWFVASWLLDDSTLTIPDDNDNPITLDLENTNRDNTSFPRANSFDGSRNEGWVAATLYDIIDPRGENGNDDIHNQESKLWKAFASNDAQTILEFETDWDNLRYPSLDNMFALNTIRENSDTENPEIEITSPYNRYTSSSTTITIRGESSDNVEVASVKLYVNNNLISTLTSNLDEWSVNVTLPRSTNTIKAVAEDTSGNSSTDTLFIFYSEPSNPPRKTVTPTSGSVTSTFTTISWSAPSAGDSPITGYDIFREASPKILIATVPSTQLSYVDSTVLPSTTYQYTVSAKNQFGSGEESDPITITTLADTEKPVIVINPPNSVTLTQGDIYSELGASCTDGIDGNISNITIVSNVDVTTVGTYQVTYDCQDAAGNNADQIIRTVHVVIPQVLQYYLQ